jgi:hypothetical protein
MSQPCCVVDVVIATVVEVGSATAALVEVGSVTAVLVVDSQLQLPH